METQYSLKKQTNIFVKATVISVDFDESLWLNVYSGNTSFMHV